MRVGVFALQGDVREHLQLLTSLGVESIEVRNAEQLASVDGLILPGGESTTISKLIDIFGLRDDLLTFISKGTPVYGTCAGMIMLATGFWTRQRGSEASRLWIFRLDEMLLVLSSTHSKHRSSLLVRLWMWHLSGHR